MTVAVVLDVNTLASAAASQWGVPGLALDHTIDGPCNLVLSEPMLGKLDEVLQRPYFWGRINAEQRERFLVTLERVASLVEPDTSVRGITDDEEDDIVLGTAVAAGAQYLVTGDHGLLDVGSHGDVSIVTAREFLGVLDVD